MSVCWYWWELFAFRFFVQKLSIIFLSPLYMRKKWPYLEFFRSVYPRILTELGEILRIPRWDAPYLSVFNLNEGEMRTRRTSNTETFHSLRSIPWEYSIYVIIPGHYHEDLIKFRELTKIWSAWLVFVKKHTIPEGASMIY